MPFDLGENSTTAVSRSVPDPASDADHAVNPHLVLVWSYEEPDRIGESAVVLGESILGRGGARADDPAPRLVFVQQRLGAPRPAPALRASRLSRRHLVVRPIDGGLDVECVGRRPLLHNGVEVAQARTTWGDVLTLRGVGSFLVELRRRFTPPPRHWPQRQQFAFGKPDGSGIIGESPGAWRLRERLAEAAQSTGHVLLLGPSGAGKELAARAVHELSKRAARKLISRNAATLPPSLVDAELFGCAKDYPNAGSPERLGLVSAADKSSLFLDELAELLDEQQSHLLRFLDRGEYQRLGETTVRRAAVRVIAATNRPIEALRHDLLARFVTRLDVPSLNQRRADIPLIIAAWLKADLQARPRVFERFLSNERSEMPQVTTQLVEALVRHDYTGNCRELEYLLRLAISTSEGNHIDVSPVVSEQLTSSDAHGGRASLMDRQQLSALLATHQGSASAVAQALGLPSRFALYRLPRKHNLRLRPPG